MTNEISNIKELSHGVYGKVFDFNSNTVIKFVDKFNSSKTRLCRQNLQEIIFLSHFNHPNIVKIKNTELGDDNICLYLEKCDTSLFDYIKETKIEIRIKELPYIFYQILGALVYMHKKCLVHGDLKPDNIMINKKTKEIKLIDFGGLMTFRHYKYNDNICTHEYCPPEGWKEFSNNEAITPKFDMWSLGLTIYFYITGNYYYQFENDEENNYLNELKNIVKTKDYLPFKTRINECLKKSSSNIQELDNELITIMEKMLQINVSDRISSIELVNSSYFENFNKIKTIYNYNYLSHKPFLLKGVRRNYNNKYRSKSISWINNLCIDKKIPEVLCLSVTMLDRYLITKKILLATYNYKLYSFIVFKIASQLITNKSIYYEDYFNYSDKIKDKNIIISKLKEITDDILNILQFKVYTDTFDWLLYRKKTIIDYDIIYDIILNHNYNEKQNKELVKLYYQLRNYKSSKRKHKNI